MLKTIDLQTDLIEELVVSTMAVDLDDLSDLLLVFPSKRMGVFYLDLLAKRVNRSFFPPAVFTIDNFIVNLFDKNFSGFRLLENIEATLILYKILQQKKYCTGLYTGEIKGSNFPDFFPWGLKIFNALESIMIENRDEQNINQKIFEQFVELGDYHREYKNFISFLPELIGEFFGVLESKKLSTRGFIYKKTAQLAKNKIIRTPEFKELIFAGFNALNHSEESILKFIIANKQATLLIKTDMKAVHTPSSPFYLQNRTVKSLGLGKIRVLNDDGKQRQPWNDFSKRVKFKPANNIETQMFSVYKTLQELVQGRKLEDLVKIGIVLPDPSSLIPFVQGVVSRFDQAKDTIPFNITLGYPFHRTPLYQLISSILKVGETTVGSKVYVRDYLDLIRHPYVKSSNLYGEGDQLRKGIRYLEDLINNNNLLYFEPVQLEEQLAVILKDLNDEDQETILKELQNLHLTYLVDIDLGLKELCTFLKNAIRGIVKEKSYLFLKEYVHAAIEALDHLEEFLDQEPESFEYVKFAKSSEFIKYYLSKRKINLEGSPLSGIQVMGMLEFRGLKFEEVLIIDAVEGTLPEALKYDPLLPYDIKNIFNMRTYTDWEKLFSFNFFSLLASSRNSYVFWSEKQQDTGKKERSRFIERIIYEAEKNDAPIKIEKQNFKLNMPGAVPNIVRKEDTVVGLLRRMSYSPSSLFTYIKCPLRFYFQKVLKLKERKKIEENPDAGTFGTIIHDVLKAFYLPMTQGESVDEIEPLLSKLVEAEFKKKNFNQDSGMIKIRSWLVSERLSKYLHYDLQNLNERTIRIEALEYKVEGKLSVPGMSPVKCSGIIDRIEWDGEICRIIDYKTGSTIPIDRPEADDADFSGLYQMDSDLYLEKLVKFNRYFSSMQLLLYLNMLSRERGLAPGSMDARYVFLKETGKWDRDLFVTRKKPWDAEPRSKYLNSFDTALSFVLEDILLRDAFLPNFNDQKYCSYCPFRNNCEKGVKPAFDFSE
jgi:CRISPR/Cas system-associated exonuclease Cas4 (RecB family)/DNA-binding MarR family transcriptional regulator